MSHSCLSIPRDVEMTGPEDADTDADAGASAESVGSCASQSDAASSASGSVERDSAGEGSDAGNSFM